MMPLTAPSLRAAALQHLWTLWDRPDGQSLLHAGRHALEDLVYLEGEGLLTFHRVATHCGCVECVSMPAGGCVVESVYTDDVGMPHLLVSCEQEGIFEVPETRLYQYRPVTGDGLARELASRLPCDGAPEMLVPHRLWALGRYRARYPLYLAREVYRQDAATVLAPLHAHMKHTPGIVLVPHALPAPGVLPAQALAVPLAQVWWWAGDTLRMTTAALDEALTALDGSKPSVYLQPVDVPAGFTWPQVRVEFISDDDVRIWTVGEPVVRSMGELGLANQRDGSPTKRWDLLREFAGHEGVYDLAHPSALYPPEKMSRLGQRPQLTAFSGKLGTALSDLAEHLRQLCPGIAGKPFARYDTRKHQYRSHIQLCWEPGYRQRKAQEYARHL